MPWNPEVYNQFKENRYLPFYDLISYIDRRPHMKILDLGCGTGELTKKLADTFADSEVLGIDSSAEMLAKAPAHPQLKVEQRTIESQLEQSGQWNLILANASLQWVNDHPSLFALLTRRLAADGQLAIQMPCQQENVLNQLLLELVHEEPYQQVLKESIRISPLLSMDAYCQLLFEAAAKDMVVLQKVYPLVADSIDQLFDFISGSAMIPYMEKLPPFLKERFTQDFKAKIAERFRKAPMLYPFKRIIIVGKF